MALSREYVLAFDTANEVIALGVGRLHPGVDGTSPSIDIIAGERIAAHRASNTRLLPEIDALLERLGVPREALTCVCVGRGPGSFTGVRIAMATAKGIASALGIALVGVSTTDAVAWGAWAAGLRGELAVAADAMRHEVYPMRYTLDEAGPVRVGAVADRVVKVEAAAGEFALSPAETMTGDALAKYADLLASGAGALAPEELWTPAGADLLLALEAAWRAGECDPFDAGRQNPAFALPVYTRLSDAEEAERRRLALAEGVAKNLVTGVQGGLEIRPMAAADVDAAAALDSLALPRDAWSAASLADELGRGDRTWWVAYQVAPGRTGAVATAEGRLLGLAGGLVVDGDLQILKVCVAPEARRRGIARGLLSRMADDARNLAAKTASLEVRSGNDGARAFYEALGFVSEGVRPRFYDDGEDALIMTAGLDGLAATSETARNGVGGKRDGSFAGGAKDGCPSPRILAIESSCDETAAAVIDGDGVLRSDVVASQIDFHARFGGVVPEIASRKHIEAICGVFDEALERADCMPADLSAVAATYAPGLVGALVVGVAFAKGVAWALDVPFIGVNHLEGHLYANKLAKGGFEPPAVVSLVSGGNTMLVHMRDWGEYEVLGTTIDDAVGEAFDKVAKALGLGYPGGPVISRLAKEGRADAVDFPRAMLHSGNYDFSLSGLKTAVITHIMKVRDEEGEGALEAQVPDICASFQQAVIDVQVAKVETALRETGAPTFCLGGGVVANPELRRAYERLCRRRGVRLVMPPLSSCGDNAGMIALVAFDRFRQGRFFDLSADAFAHADLGRRY
ncbi:MAG: tRNA (adenosine(37)-N6)-threonylcarbamoyltransferase complex transferase subunit TsaD [Eggerthellaceae bacterium]|nr:tRNA (adenosine(37)-N6)-threonylcarbamoyltransferase complex transferase subunit TsaD [Eggerthellaceae bacterium]